MKQNGVNDELVDVITDRSSGRNHATGSRYKTSD